MSVGTGEFVMAFHSNVEGDAVDGLDGTMIEPMHRVEYIGITNLSVHVKLRDGTYIRITNPGTFTDGLKVEVEKPDADS